MAAPSLIGRHIGERVRVRLAPWGSVVGEVVEVDETAIAVRLSDGTIATVPIAAVVSIRERAAWSRSSA